MTVAEQNAVGFDQPVRPGPVVIELDSGVRVFALMESGMPARLCGHQDGQPPFDISPSPMEVHG